MSVPNSGKRIFVYGSCVSRDILNFGGESLVLVDYFARSSIASAFDDRAVADRYSETLASPFQRRIVAADLSKQLVEHLRDGDFDTLLIDFIDERFDLFCFDDGSICTLSGELLNAGFLKSNPVGRVVKSGSDDFFDLWVAGWNRLWVKLGALGLRDRLRLNRVFWATETVNGTGFLPTYKQGRIDAANLLLERLYAHAANDLAPHQFLEFPKSVFIGGTEHRWGTSPFHYVDDYYLTASRRLSSEPSIESIKEKKLLHIPSVPVGPSDYSMWRCPLHDAENLKGFLAKEEFENGIHRIPCGGGTLDVLIQGLAALRKGESGACLVGLGGALSDRTGTRPPYFSGRGVAGQLKLPLVAISDPSFALDETLPLAWYAGNSGERQLNHMIAKVLDCIAHRYNLRLVLFGGSGGGFAALVQAGLLTCELTAVVWNPQTSIEQYVPKFVLHYLKSAFAELADEADAALALAEPEQKQRVAQLLGRAGICHSVVDAPLSQQAKVLYLQNRHDWHVAAHAKPYLGRSGWRRLGVNSFAQGETLALHLGNWGAGHAPAPVELVTRVVGAAAQGRSVAEIAADLATASSADEYCQWFAADLPDSDLKPRATSGDADGLLRLTVDMPSLPSASQLEYALYLIKNRERKKAFWYQASPTFEMPLAGLEIDAIQVFVRDFWRDVRIGYYPWPIAVSTPAAPVHECP